MRCVREEWGSEGIEGSRAGCEGMNDGGGKGLKDVGRGEWFMEKPILAGDSHMCGLE